MSPNFRPRNNINNTRYNTMDNNNRHNNNHSHSRSPPSGPPHQYNYNNNENISNINTLFPNNSPIIQPGNTPQTTTGLQTPGSDHSASHSMTPQSYNQNKQILIDPNNSNSALQNISATGDNGTNGNNNNDCAAGELYGAIYQLNGSEPSIAYPVIKVYMQMMI